MSSLYRYFSKRNAQAFVERGEVLFRSLSYFRDYEDAGVRSDEHEGTLVYLPKDGLKVNNVATGKVVATPHQMEATVKEDDIFIYCLSTELSEEIAQRFNAEVVVEIHEITRFLALVRSSLALRKRLQVRNLISQPVHYYELHEPPIVDWALPERIAMRKPISFGWQKEHRIAVPLGDAFRVENVSVSLVLPGTQRPPRTSPHPSVMLKLGNLSKICRVHEL